MSDAVDVPAGSVTLGADLTVPPDPFGVVVFAHGSGSSRHSPRNRYVAETLNARGLATVLLDLLAGAEEADRRNVFDIDLIATRLVAATGWVAARPELAHLPVGYFGASTGAAAALVASADTGANIRAVVSRGGRADLAAPRYEQVTAPTLLIVGGNDGVVIELNRQAQAALACPTELVVVPGAGHLFEEPGALSQVAEMAADWFLHHMAPEQ